MIARSRKIARKNPADDLVLLLEVGVGAGPHVAGDVDHLLGAGGLGLHPLEELPGLEQGQRRPAHAHEPPQEVEEVRGARCGGLVGREGRLTSNQRKDDEATDHGEQAAGGGLHDRGNSGDGCGRWADGAGAGRVTAVQIHTADRGD